MYFTREEVIYYPTILFFCTNHYTSADIIITPSIVLLSTAAIFLYNYNTYAVSVKDIQSQTCDSTIFSEK